MPSELINAALRARAEEVAGRVPAEDDGDEVKRLSHELTVHEIELSMQCEALQHAQQELEESREEYRALYEQAPIGYFTCTRRGVIVRANPSLATLTGVSVTELVGSSFQRFAGPNDRDVFHRHTVALRSGATATCRMQLVRANGELRDIRLDSRAQTKPDGTTHLCVCVVDLTEQLRAEQRVREVTEHSRREKQRLQVSKLEAVGELAGGIAHDFNNLLVGISCNLALARDHPQQADEILDEAERAAQRAAGLTSQLLAFAKGGAPVKRPTSLAELITETARFSLRGSTVELELALAPDLRSVDGDAGQLGQVIQNLVINAKEAMPKGGRVRIETRNVVLEHEECPPLAVGDYVLITVEDDGAGICEADLPRIFDPYVTTKDRSSGLGLATVFAVVRGHGGLITARSRVGAGTTMNIYLPASSSPAPIVAEPGTRARTVARRAGRILVMDDEVVLRRLYRRMLSMCGHEVDIVAHGGAAVEAYRESQAASRPYDVVVLDLTVPGGMGGVAALAELRAVDPAVRALACSGYSVDPAMADPAQYGFCGVVKKPFRPEELIDAIEAAMKARRSPL